MILDKQQLEETLLSHMMDMNPLVLRECDKPTQGQLDAFGVDLASWLYCRKLIIKIWDFEEE
jgi:hypothetical protein